MTSVPLSVAVNNTQRVAPRTTPQWLGSLGDVVPTKLLYVNEPIEPAPTAYPSNGAVLEARVAERLPGKAEKLLPPAEPRSSILSSETGPGWVPISSAAGRLTTTRLPLLLMATV